MSAPNFSNSNPVRNDFLVFGSPKIEQEEIDEVVECLKSGWIGTGPRVNKFVYCSVTSLYVSIWSVNWR